MGDGARRLRRRPEPQRRKNSRGDPDGVDRGGGIALRLARPRGTSKKDKVEGEGSSSGTRDYNERTRRFIKSGRVGTAARKAALKSKDEARAMVRAERAGRSRAKR